MTVKSAFSSKKEKKTHISSAGVMSCFLGNVESHRPSGENGSSLKFLTDAIIVCK